MTILSTGVQDEFMAIAAMRTSCRDLVLRIQARQPNHGAGAAAAKADANSCRGM